MTIQVDHIALPAYKPEESARFLAEVLGGLSVSQDGPEGEFYRVDLSPVTFVLFAEAPHVAGQHLAFSVGIANFSEVIEQLKRLGRPFGNDPEDPSNGLVEDFQGTAGRIYFFDPSGHLLEVVAT